ncbi:uncharacterized protein [Argopecten irradians]|uniref:uncharacterized protein n=1 Tax=Argopecten irradians TaxID=31199 RepID=UPI003717008C
MLKPTILIHVTLEICFLLLTIFFVKILDGKHVTPALEQNNPLPQAKRTLEKPTFATSTGNNKASPPSGINSRTMPEARFSFRQARQRMLNGQKTKDRQPTSVSRNNQRPQKEPRNVPLNRHVYNGKYAATVTSIQTGTGELIITDPVMVIRNILLDQQRFPNRTLDATLSQEFQAALEKLQEQNNHTRRNKRKRSTIQRNGRNRQLRNQRVSRPTEVARAKINNRKNKAVENSFSGRRSSSTTRSTSRIQPGNIARDPNGKIVFNSPMTGIAYRGSDSTIQQPGGFRSIQHSRRFQSPARTVMSSDFYTSLFNTLTEADDPAVEQSPKNKFQQMQERQINVTHDYRSQRIVNDPIEIQRKSSNIQKHRVTTTGETSTQKQHSDKRRLTIANKKSSNSVSKSNIQSLSHRFIPSMGLHIPDYKTLRGNSQLVTQKVQRLSSSGNPVTFNVETNPQGDSAPSHQHTFPTEGSSGNMPPASSKSTDTINESFEPSLNLASGDITTVQHQIERPGVLDNLIANVESAIGISGVTDRRGRSHSPAFGIGELPTTTGHGDVNHATLKSKQQRSLVPSGSDPVLQKVQRYSSNGKIVTFDVETLPDAFQKESNKDINVFENPATQPSQPESHIVKAWDRKRQQTTTVTRYTPSGSPVTFNVETPATTNTEGIHENVDKVTSLTSRQDTNQRKNVREVSSKVSNSPALVLEHPGEEQPAGVRETATIGSKGNDFLTGSKAKDILTDSKDLYENQSHVHITNERPSGINKRKRNSLAEKMDRLHTVLHSIMDELQSTSMAIHNKKNLITTVEELTTGMTHSMLNHNPSGQIEKAESNIVQEKRKQTSLVNQEISQQAQVVKHISPSIQPVTKLQLPHTQQKSKTKLKSRNKNHQHHQLNSKQHEHLSKIKHSAKQSSEANMRSSTHQHHAVKHQQQKSNKKNIRHGDIGQDTGHLDKNQQHQGIIKQIQTRPPQQTQHKAQKQKQKQKQKSQKQLQQFPLQRQKQKVSQEHKQQKVLKEQKQNEQQEHQPQQKQQLTHPKLSHKQQVSQQQQQSQQQQLLQEQQQQQRLSPQQQQQQSQQQHISQQQQQQQQSQQQQKSQKQQLSQKQQKSKLQQKSQQQQKSHKQQLSQQQQQLLQKNDHSSHNNICHNNNKSHKSNKIHKNQQMSQQQQHSPQQQKKAQQEQLSQQQQLPQQQRQKTLQQMSIHQQQLSKQVQQSQQQQLLQQQMPQQLQLSQHQRSQQQQQLQQQKRHQLKQKQQQQPQQQLQQQQFQQQNQPRNQHKQQEKHQTFAISSVRKSINRHIPPVTDITLHIPATGHGSLRMQIKSNIGNISYAR